MDWRESRQPSARRASAIPSKFRGKVGTHLVRSWVDLSGLALSRNTHGHGSEHPHRHRTRLYLNHTRTTGTHRTESTTLSEYTRSVPLDVHGITSLSLSLSRIRIVLAHSST